MATGRTTKFCLKVEEVQGMLGNLSFAKNFSHNWDIRFQSEIWIKKLVVSYAANLAPQLLKQHYDLNFNMRKLKFSTNVLGRTINKCINFHLNIFNTELIPSFLLTALEESKN